MCQFVVDIRCKFKNVQIIIVNKFACYHAVQGLGPPLPGSATPKIHHSQGEPLYTVSKNFIKPTSVSPNHYYFNQFQLLPALLFFINPASTDAMVIQHIFNKSSCIRIQLLVSVKGALFHHPIVQYRTRVNMYSLCTYIHCISMVSNRYDVMEFACVPACFMYIVCRHIFRL